MVREPLRRDPGAWAVGGRPSKSWPGKASTRDVILSTIASQPGLHMSELMRLLGVGWGTVAYHVQVLRRRGAISVFSPGREARLFPSGASFHDVLRIATARAPAQAGILECLRRTPGMRAQEIADALGRNPQAIRRQLNALHEVGLISWQGSYARRYFAQDARPTAIGAFLQDMHGAAALPPGLPGPEAPAPRRRSGQASRATILATVRTTPGIHASDLARAAHVSWANLSHHLRLLEQGNLVVRWAHGGKVHYFLPEVPRAEWGLHVARRSAISREILDALEGRPGIGVGELSRLTGLEPQDLGRRVRRLVGDGIVRRSGPLDEGSAWPPQGHAAPPAAAARDEAPGGLPPTLA